LLTAIPHSPGSLRSLFPITLSQHLAQQLLNLIPAHPQLLSNHIWQSIIFTLLPQPCKIAQSKTGIVVILMTQEDFKSLQQVITRLLPLLLILSE
jgi:hypothetical protein